MPAYDSHLLYGDAEAPRDYFHDSCIRGIALRFFFHGYGEGPFNALRNTFFFLPRFHAYFYVHISY